MKKRVQFFGILFFMLIGHLVFAQSVHFGVTAGAGVGKLSITKEIRNYNGNPFRFSGHAGFFMQNKISENWSFRVGFQYVQIRSQNKIVSGPIKPSDSISGGNSGGGVMSTLDLSLFGDAARKNTLNYASFPLTLRWQSKKLALKFGAQPMLLGLATTEKDDQKNDLEGLTRFDIGPQTGIEFRLGSQIWLSADFYAGIISVADGDKFHDRYNLQALLGINYYLTNKN